LHLVKMHTPWSNSYDIEEGTCFDMVFYYTAHSPSSHPISKHFQKFPSVCGGRLISVKRDAGFCIHSIQSPILQTIIDQCLHNFYLVYAISRYGQICSTSTTTTTSGCNANVVEFNSFFACSHLWWPKEEIAESKWNMEDLLFLENVLQLDGFKPCELIQSCPAATFLNPLVDMDHQIADFSHLHFALPTVNL
jgi:hypothetical protein